MFPLRPTLLIGSFRQSEPLVFCHYSLEVVIFGSLRSRSSEVAASDFRAPRYRFVTVIRWFGEELKVHRHNVTCVTDQLPWILRSERRKIPKNVYIENRREKSESYANCVVRHEKKTHRGGYINIHNVVVVCKTHSLRLSEFIHEFSLSQAVINAATTGGAETLPSLALPPPFRLPNSLTSPCPVRRPFVEERVAYK